MSNPYFQFKQFIVHQGRTAMKVCTDACIFGAWVAKDSKNNSAENILDIGTGTGLLTLMLAQATASNTSTHLTAIEIETNAYNESLTNFSLCPWRNRIHALHISLQEFALTKTVDQSKKFDCIISNPPFYEDDLKSPFATKNIAAHSTKLSWQILIENTALLLEANGIFYVLIPAIRSYTMQKICADNGLQLIEEVLLCHNSQNSPFRSLQKYIKNKNSTDVIRKQLVIKDTENQYSAELQALLKDYYLHL